VVFASHPTPAPSLLVCTSWTGLILLSLVKPSPAKNLDYHKIIIIIIIIIIKPQGQK